ncbi:TIGR02391 family protein [Erysipelothrix rhusiopathiae]|nr:TIGR02391 family protein [Erysipelothrix rhusiopathiae]MDE8224746.1 TIGR02391 family protein [Erysipelothrix rhusiopathiae]
MMLMNKNSIEEISKIIGEHLTGTEITKLLEAAEFPTSDYLENWTKWRRLDKLFNQYLGNYHSQNHVIKVIELFLDPRKFINRDDVHKDILEKMNLLLAFDGIKVLDSGKFQETEIVTTLSEANINASSFKSKLTELKVHPKIMVYCTPDILNEDYTSIILESTKGLYEEIRTKTGLTKDGARLIDECFCIRDPYIVFNNLETENEINEHRGYMELLKAITSLFRNPRAHTPKIYSVDNETDCIQILNLISFAYYRLDISTLIKSQP